MGKRVTAGACARFAGGLVLVYRHGISRCVDSPKSEIFYGVGDWAAFILTRPLGAVSGDLFDKPVAQGGMAISRYTASGVLAVAIVVCVLIFPQRAARSTGH